MNVVVGVIKNAEGHVLVARRASHQSHSQKLEFPGGKINPEEPHFSALVRELQEELGISVQEARFAMDVSFEYPKEGRVHLHVWLVELYEGMPFGAEGQEVFWLPLEDIRVDDFLHANAAIIDYLQRDTLA